MHSLFIYKQMADNSIFLIDIEKVLHEKAPNKAKYVPGFVVSYFASIVWTIWTLNWRLLALKICPKTNSVHSYQTIRLVGKTVLPLATYLESITTER